MADDGKPTEPTEGDGESRRTKLLKRSRDVTDLVGGYIFVGLPVPWPEMLPDEPEEPGDDPGQADAPDEPPGA